MDYPRADNLGIDLNGIIMNNGIVYENKAFCIYSLRSNRRV